MRKVLLTAAISAISTAAFAADAVVYDNVPAAEVVVTEATNWSGVYVGIAGGAFWADANPNALSKGANNSFESFDFDKSGATASIYGGYNWQLNNSVVLGIEGEVSWLDMDFRADRFSSTGPWTYLKADWSAGISARAGYLFTPSLLGYGKLGYNWTNFKAGKWNTPDSIDDGTIGAVQIGAGLEAMLTSNIILRGEVAYNFAMDDVSISYGNLDYKFKPDYGTAKIGIAYKF